MIDPVYIFINKDIENSLTKIIRSKALVQGQKVQEFEKKLTQVCNTKYAVVVNSGTAALHSALSSIGLKPGDEVITSSFSFIATANAILMCGARPIFVDVEKDSFNLNPNLIESKITTKTKAILAVDLFGKPCDYEKIRKIAKKYNLKIISDSCQAIGALYKKKPIPNWVDIACFSFYATKNITMVEGGALVTNSKKVYDFVRRFRQHGQDTEKPYIYHHLGYNYRSTDVLATIGLIQINYLESWNLKRFNNAKYLISKLNNIPGIIPPNLPTEKHHHVFHQFSIQVTNGFPLSRDKLRLYLKKHGVKTNIYYPTTLPSQTFIAKITPYKKSFYPVAETHAKQILSLPIHHMLKKSELNYIASLIKMVS